MIEKHTTISSQLLILQSGFKRILGHVAGELANLYCMDDLVSGL